ncbi:type II secretion system protein GspD [Wolbachia endosymbiont of Ctenocephalides felis wCfeT]|uniref:type II secretion system protein GspD n=1 Tax=Wolbachia endosymbiont of Ctenocephalides felis wCfeT TaxID=2732593 RepID=UPI001444B093|nr:secretion system protein [Wolbachia endosymbiont of Ctenocephalides felis wCfeT]
MAIFKYLIILFIVSCTHLPIKQHKKSFSSFDNENHYHDVSKHHGYLMQYKPIAKEDEPPVPEVIPLPIILPDITASNQVISINVSEEVPVKELLMEIGKLSDINLDIDPEISGSIILKLRDKNINEAIQNIADSAKLRCSVSNGVIRVEQDLPYSKNYYVDFINVQHSAQSSFVINNNITSDGESDDSNNVMKSQYVSDLWTSLEKGLNTIMDVNGVDDGEFMSSSRETGVIILNARKGVHKAVEEYINQAKRLASSQVMIEAKIVEVILDDKYISGMNLSDLHNSGDINEEMNFGVGNLTDLIKNLDKFGTSTVVSSPRVHAVNNQQAMISFVKNHVYFTSEVQKDAENSNHILITKMNSVPIGIVLIIHPSINLDTNEIFMNVHPTLSRISSYTQDPGIEYISQQSGATLNSDIPIVEIREMNSMLKIKNGEIMVIGGLIEHREDKQSLSHHKSQELADNTRTVETVIFLKATIVPTFGLLDSKDKGLYALSNQLF